MHYFTPQAGQVITVHSPNQQLTITVRQVKDGKVDLYAPLKAVCWDLCQRTDGWPTRESLKSRPKKNFSLQHEVLLYLLPQGLSPDNRDSYVVLGKAFPESDSPLIYISCSWKYQIREPALAADSSP